MRAYLRRNTYDAAIWSSVASDYRQIPDRLRPGDVVVDVGCHSGAFTQMVVQRGATAVVAAEANRENHALAAINLAACPEVTLVHAAVWRSDVGRGELRFVPSVNACNTGAGSVLFDGPEGYRRHIELGAVEAWQRGDEPQPDAAHRLGEHPVATVALDTLLAPFERVEVLKIDVEGAEFPILLTARLLDRVELIVGEYHELTGAQMAALPRRAVVGSERYSVALLTRCLDAAGFDVESRPVEVGQGLFSARRRRGARSGAP